MNSLARGLSLIVAVACLLVTFTLRAAAPRTRVSIADRHWRIDGKVTYRGAKAEGLLLNVRMVNATFEDRKRPEFDPEKNADEFIAKIPDYAEHGVRAFTLNLQGGMPGYEGAVDSAFEADGLLRDSYLARVRRVIEACDQNSAVVILGCYYQRQDQVLKDEEAVRAGVVNVVKWIQASGFSNVVLEIANEFGHGGFDHRILKQPEGQVELIRLAKQTAPELLVSTSGLGGGSQHDQVARVSDFLLVHCNSTPLQDIPKRIAALKKHGKPIVCNEDQKWGEDGAKAAEVCVANGASWGLMLEKVNQHFPFAFQGAADDPIVYAALKRLAAVQPVSRDGVSSRKDAFESAFRPIREAVERGEVPGAIALVARGGKILRQEAYGLRDIENQLPFTTNTLCWIASITKPVTVATAMTLVDAGKLGLDDPVEKYLPEFREQTDTNGVHHAFTIRQLMSHTSGLVPNPPTRRSGWPLGGPLDDSWLEKNLPDIVQTIARSQLRFKPGSKFEYSNSSLFILGRVIEVISGQSYAAYVKERILDPLGMAETQYAPASSTTNRIAVIYARRDGKRETIFRFNPGVAISNTAPDGGLFSYPSQLLPFLQMFLDNDGKVLSRRAVTGMLTAQPHGWGLGWSLAEGLFLHEGSSGTLAFADPASGVIGVMFLQYRDQNKIDERLRQQFRTAVRDAFAESKGESEGRLSSRPVFTADYFPPPESQGGWRKLENPEEIRRVGGMDPEKLADLEKWLLDSDKRNFAAVVIRHGHVVLEVERGNSAKTDARRVASVSKAICATVLAIASEQSQNGSRKMRFDDPAFQFIPWAQPLSDPRKQQITVKQLLNHTSGICPEATGAPNDGRWEYIMGHTGDDRTAKLAFDPGTGCGYSTHGLAHAALVCEAVTGKPYDEFAIEAIFKPIGAEHWWFQYYDGAEKYGRHPSHGMGMPARDLARIAYCMLHGGRWNDRQVIPKWFVDETAAPTHNVKTPEMRWKLNPQIFSHGWELPARLTGEGGRSGAGIPADARAKPGSGGQYIAFVPSLDLVVTRHTGSSGDWQYEEYLRRACKAVLPKQSQASVSNEPSSSALRERGHARVEVTRPTSFPHRIWAACDFESRTPDYAWFGPAETNNFPRYPGNATALGASARPYQNFSAIMTGINPVPGPRMGKSNHLYLRYHLTGSTEATFQHFSLSSEDNNHIRIAGLTEGKWSEVTMNFTRDGLRNDGTPGVPFKDGERMDDLKIFVGKPADTKRYDLLVDDVMFFANDPELPPEPEPFPNRVIFLAAFDTGPKEKYWPGEFEIAEKDLPAGSFWRVARAVPRKDGKGKWIRLQLEPHRTVGAQTGLRFRYHLTGSRRMTVQMFDVTDTDNRHVNLRDLKTNQWQTLYLDFTRDGRRNDGSNTPFAAGHKLDDLFFFVQPDGSELVELLIDEVVLYDRGQPADKAN